MRDAFETQCTLQNSNVRNHHRTFTSTISNDMFYVTVSNKSSAVAEMGDRDHNGHGLKRGGNCCAPFAERGAGSPSNTIWPGMRPTSVPSGILIHPAVWPQWTWLSSAHRKKNQQIFGGHKFGSLGSK